MCFQLLRCFSVASSRTKIRGNDTGSSKCRKVIRKVRGKRRTERKTAKRINVVVRRSLSNFSSSGTSNFVSQTRASDATLDDAANVGF